MLEITDLPEKIERVLADLELDIQAIDVAEESALRGFVVPTEYAPLCVHIVYLKDEQGVLQAVLARNQIADIHYLQRHLKRPNLTALTAAELTRINQQVCAPFIQLQANTPAYIDAQLIKQPHLFLLVDGKKWLKLARTSFKKLYGEACVLPLGIKIKTQKMITPERDLADVNHAIMQFSALRIKQRLNETLDLPPLPETAKRIIELRTDINADTSSLSTAVELDPAMSAQVISWARSPFYGAPKDSIKTVEDAILRVLGFDLVMNLALGLALGKTLSVPKSGVIGYNSFWQQAVMVATLCAELSRSCQLPERPSYGLAYLCGLMHNFGYLILAQVFPPQFQSVGLYLQVNQHVDGTHIEQHLLGMSKEQISALLFQQWQLPDELVVATRQQKNTDFSGTHWQYAALIQLAYQALRRQGYGYGPMGDLNASLLTKLHIKADIVEEKAATLVSQLDAISTIVAALNSK